MEELSHLLMRENVICYFHRGSSAPAEWRRRRGGAPLRGVDATWESGVISLSKNVESDSAAVSCITHVQILFSGWFFWWCRHEKPCEATNFTNQSVFTGLDEYNAM